MEKILSRTQLDILEQLIDENGLGNIINAISVICYEKADHLETNWQDKQQAKIWRKAGLKLNKTAFHQTIDDATF